MPDCQDPAQDSDALARAKWANQMTLDAAVTSRVPTGERGNEPCSLVYRVDHIYLVRDSHTATETQLFLSHGHNLQEKIALVLCVFFVWFICYMFHSALGGGVGGICFTWYVIKY